MHGKAVSAVVDRFVYKIYVKLVSVNFILEVVGNGWQHHRSNSLSVKFIGSSPIKIPFAGKRICSAGAAAPVVWIERQENNMHISYKPLWHTLLERDMRKEDLRLAAGMTTNMIANMSKEGKHISMDTLARICETLNCEITDVIELVPDEPASTGGKEHERIETKNKRKRN